MGIMASSDWFDRLRGILLVPKSKQIRHGPLQAGHPWIVVVCSEFDRKSSFRHPSVARLKRAMTKI
jgi:hypothetical protein